MRCVTWHGHRKHFDLFIRVCSTQLFLEQHRKRKPLRIVLRWLIRPHHWHSITECNRVAQTNDAIRSSFFTADWIVGAKTLRVCRKDCVVPDNVMKVWFQAPE